MQRHTKVAAMPISKNILKKAKPTRLVLIGSGRANWDYVHLMSGQNIKDIASEPHALPFIILAKP